MLEHIHNDRIALVYIQSLVPQSLVPQSLVPQSLVPQSLAPQSSELAEDALRRAILRIRRNIRQHDVVMLLEASAICVVILPETVFIGAQAVGKRLSALLVDIEHEMKIFSGIAAYTLLQRLQCHSQVTVITDEEVAVEMPAVPFVRQVYDGDTLPYLACLSNYPTPRLLHLFPYALACRYRCVPVGVERGILTLATSQRLDHTLVEHFRAVTQRAIFQVRCEAGMIDDVLSYWQRIIFV